MSQPILWATLPNFPNYYTGHSAVTAALRALVPYLKLLAIPTPTDSASLLRIRYIKQLSDRSPSLQ